MLRATQYGVAIGSNSAIMVLPPNPRRTYLRINAPSGGSWTIGLNVQVSSSVAGFRLQAGSMDFEITRDEIGDLITHAVYMFNATGGNATVPIIEGMD